MKSNMLVRRFARNAALTSLAGVCLLPQDHVGVLVQRLPATKSTTVGADRIHDPKTITTSENVTLTFHEVSRDWTKADEREFRRLSLKEATANITDEELRKLNRLSRRRDNNLDPPNTYR